MLQSRDVTCSRRQTAELLNSQTFIRSIAGDRSRLSAENLDTKTLFLDFNEKPSHVFLVFACSALHPPDHNCGLIHPQAAYSEMLM